MRTEEVLSALGAGLWTWENATGLVTLDAHAARLLGFDTEPGGPAALTLQGNAVRSHVHAVDYVGFQGILTLSLAEQAPAESQMRVVDGEGTVLRTVRAFIRPCDPADDSAPEDAASGGGARVAGLVYEVPEPESEEDGDRTAPQTDAEAAQSAAAADWDWRRSREAFLLDTGRALAEVYTTADVLRVAAALAMPGFSPEATTLFVVDGDRLDAVGPTVTGDGGRRRMRLTADHPATEAVRTGRPLYLTSPENYARRFPGAARHSAQFRRQSRAYLPLIVAGRTIGAWMTAFPRPMAFSPDERAVLTTVARMLAQALSRATLYESERKLSEGLQRTMRPARKPAIPGMELAARYIPTGGGLEVGGDWYDVIPLPSGRTALVIGDVQGHDVRAAAIMGQLRIALRAYASEGHRPDAVLARAARFLYGMSGGEASTSSEPPEQDEQRTAPPAAPGTTGASAPASPGAAPVTDPEAPGDAESEASYPRFATCLYIEVDPVNGTLDIARAGHHDPAVQLPDGPMLVRPTAGGLPLGIEPDTDYPTTRLVLEPGERLLMCTDGLIETGGHDLDTGWSRIREIVTENSGEGTDLETLADALVEGVLGAPQQHAPGPLVNRHEDDIALLLLAPGPAAPGQQPGGATDSSRRTVLTIAQAEPDRIAEARHQLRDLLHGWADEDQADGAVLMLSEMLTNVLVHTDGDAVVIAEITGPVEERRLRVQVLDASDELPHRRSPGELASSGRGLMLLGMLADRWGVDPRGEGKCIWFEIQEKAATEE